MAGFSMFHFFIVVLIVLLVAAPMAYFGILRERSGRRMKRGAYALTFLGLMVGYFILAALLQGASAGSATPLLSLIWVAIEFRLLRLTVRRLRDIGWSRNWAFPCLIPYLGLLAHLAFCFVPSGGPDAVDIIEAF